MDNATPLIIEAAINGATPKDRNPHVPRTVDEIVESALACLDAYLAMLDGTGLPWLVAVVGGDVVAEGLARFAIERGGHVRVGLEDYDGPRVPRNEDLVREVVALAAAAERPVGAPGEAAEILDLRR